MLEEVEELILFTKAALELLLFGAWTLFFLLLDADLVAFNFALSIRED